MASELLTSNVIYKFDKVINKIFNKNIVRNLFFTCGFLSSFLNYAQDSELQIRIGEFVWMKKNLDVVTFRNGDTIPLAKTNQEWEEAGENGRPAWCYYDNNSQNGEKYGKLYNWFAVNDPRGLAPVGWHIASDKEWRSLTDFLGGDKISGKKLKSSSGWTDYKGKGKCTACEKWSSEYKAGNTCASCKDKREIFGSLSGNGSDEIGFSALPGGYRFSDGYFSRVGEFGGWWTSNDGATHYTWTRTLVSKSNSILRTFYDKEDGLYVRCIKD